MTLSDINTHLGWLDYYLEKAQRYLSPDDKESMQWLLEQIHTIAPEKYPSYRDRFLTALPSFEKRLRAFEQNVGKTALQRRVDFFGPGQDAYAAAQTLRRLSPYFEGLDVHPAPDVNFSGWPDKSGIPNLAELVEAMVIRRDFSRLSYVVGLMMHLADHALLEDCVALVAGARGLIQLARDDFFVVDPPKIDLLKEYSEEVQIASVWSRIFHDDLLPVIGYELDHQAIYRVLSDLDPSLAEFYLQTVIGAERPPATLREWILSQKDYFVILVEAAANLARASGQDQKTFVPLEEVWEQFLYLLIARAAQKLPPEFWHEDREELLEKAVVFQNALRGLWQSPLPVSFQPETPVPALTHPVHVREGVTNGGVDGPVAFGGMSALAMPSSELTRESELPDRPLFQIVAAEEPAVVSPIGFHIVGASPLEAKPEESAASILAIGDRLEAREGMKFLGGATTPRPVLGASMNFALRVIR